MILKKEVDLAVHWAIGETSNCLMVFWWLGFNVDLWNIWKNEIGKPNQTRGATYKFVLHPWLEAGFLFQ